MPSSSAYAAPIDLDLRPGRWEQGGRVAAGLLALGALVLSALPLQIGLLGAALAMLFLVRDSAKTARRPQRMRLYADGGVECPVPWHSNFRDQQASAPVGAGSARDLFSHPAQSSRAQPAPTGAPNSLVQSTASEAASMHPATLLQATTFLGLTQLRWADANDAHHACVVFPDRIDADTRHRVRVWLATHRPETPLGALPPGSAPL